MHRLKCAEVWGGIRDEDLDACSGTVHVSLFSTACDGGKGGDIYFLSVCAEDKLTRIALADVVGHGAQASRVSQWLLEAMRRRMNDLEGHEVLRELNALATRRGLDAMTTAAVTGFYRADSQLYFSYAGHHPALLLRKNERRWHAVTSADEEMEFARPVNLPLGVLDCTEYLQHRLPLRTGDRVALYTDGLIEAPDNSGDHFGLARLLDVLDRMTDLPLPMVKSTVIAALRAHTAAALTHDDVTLLLVEVL